MSSRLAIVRVPAYRFALGVIALAVAVVGFLAVDGQFHAPAHRTVTLLVLALLTMITEHVRIKVPLQHDDVSFSPSQLFGFAVLLMFGPAAAIVAAAGAALVSDLLRRKPVIKLAFNGAQFALAMAAAGQVLVLLSDLPASGAATLTFGNAPAILAAGATFWVTNHVLTATVSALAIGLPLRRWLAHQSLVVILVDGLLLAFSPVVVLVALHGLMLLPLIGIPFLALALSAREAERRKHEALHDALTGLPNRSFFVQRAERALRDPEAAAAPPAVLLLDVDRFKEINDALGHAAGDEALRELGERLRDVVGPGDFVARLGGDKFAILHERPASDDECRGLAARVRARLDEPLVVARVLVTAGASVGIARAGDDGLDALIRRADVAMRAAKSSGGIAGYDAACDPRRPDRLERMAELRAGIPRGELVVHYQPKLSIETGRICGVEALVRWQHPVHGLLYPDAFIDLAENTEIMEALTLNVLTAALDQVAEWRRGGERLSVAVNMSAQTLLDRTLATRIARMLELRGLDGTALELEITERTLMSDRARSAAVLEDLSALGVRVSIDDFGTGYSSLALLQRLPVHQIKVDRSFVREMTEHRHDAAIVRSIVHLGRALGIEVVAEGVETDAELEQLRGYGCHTAQGYLISRPVPGPELTSWLADRTGLDAKLSRMLPFLPGDQAPV